MRAPVQREDGGSMPAPPLQVRLLDYKTAQPFVEKWHYSANMPSGKNICFGGFIGNELYVVASYGHGANMNKPWTFLSKVTGLPVEKDNLVELKRLCRTEPPQHFPLTQFLSLCHRILRKQFGVRFIISFSDPDNNRHFTPTPGKVYQSGGVYKAANFQHIGKTGEEMHVQDADGNLIHRRVAYKQMWRENLLHCAANGVSVQELKAGWKHATNRKKWAGWAKTLPQVRAELGYTPIKTPAKDRWFLDLG
jgi:hypothetical protein